ncbi:MAG: hypothetical protein MK108_00365 [Mariniblastus sp.]|nr:hypothetical protein [Mariniblastus sp.]
MLQTNFVPVAFDQWYQRKEEDREGRFYQQIARQGPRDDMKLSTQGFYILRANGQLLHYSNSRGPERIKSLMQQALTNVSSEPAEPIQAGDQRPRIPANQPPGAVVIQVNTKVLGGYPESDAPYRQIMQNAVGRDNLWIYAAEIEQLAEGQFPDSLARKLVRFHAVDNTRGEAPMWSDRQIESLAIQMGSDGAVQGSVNLATDDGKRSYRADIRGHVELDQGALTRFDLVLKGEFVGQGRFTPGAPPGAFPLAVALRIASDRDVASQVRPQALKAVGPGYLQMGAQ